MTTSARVLCGATGLLVLFALAACGGSTEHPNAPQGSGSQPRSAELSGAPSVEKIAEADNTIVNRVRPQFLECYSEGLRSDPKAAGKALYLVQIDASGRVTKMGLQGLQGQLSEGVLDCVAAAIRSAGFDIPRGESEWLAVPVSLFPEDLKASRPQ